jgi:hypothetical protein
VQPQWKRLQSDVAEELLDRLSWLLRGLWTKSEKISFGSYKNPKELKAEKFNREER